MIDYQTIQTMRDLMSQDSDLEPELKAVAFCDCPRCVAMLAMTNFSAYLENVFIPELNLRDTDDVGTMFQAAMLNSRLMSATSELDENWECFEKINRAMQDEIPF